MMDVMQAIQKTPPSASAQKIGVPANAEDTAEVEANESRPEAKNLGTTMSEIDRLIPEAETHGKIEMQIRQVIMRHDLLCLISSVD
jgi:hypothetical protein